MKLPQLSQLTPRGRAVGACLLLTLIATGGMGIWHYTHGQPFFAARSTRSFADSGGSLASNPHCRFLRSEGTSDGGTRNFYICTRPSGSTFKANEVIAAPTPTPSPTPSWVATCEVDTPSVLIDDNGPTRGTAGYFMTTNLGGPGIAGQLTDPVNSLMYVDYSGTNSKWTNATDLVAEVQNPTNAPGRFTIRITSGRGNSKYTFVIGANETQKLSFALMYDAVQNVPQYRWTGPVPIYESDPTITPVRRVYGTSGVDVATIIRFAILPDSTYSGWSNSIRIKSLVKTCRPTNYFYGMMDQFGQLTGRGNFPNKVNSVADLQADAQQTQTDSFPWGAVNQYFTPTSNPTVGANDGKWKFAKVNSRWTLVDPLGVQTKIDGVNFIDGFPNTSSGQLSEIHNYTDLSNSYLSRLYTSLPDPSGVAYWSYRSITGKNGYVSEHYDASIANLSLKYNTADYAAQHLDRSVKRLHTWGINTVVKPNAALIAADTMRTVEWIGLSSVSGYKKLSTGYGTMPDPFDSAFATVAGTQAAALVTKYAGHTGLNIGVYSDNELEWGNAATAASRFSIPITTLKQASDSPAKIAFRDLMQTQYTAISNLNAVWGTTYSSWTDFLNQANASFATPAIGSAIGNDLDSFNLAYANQYFQTVKTQLTNAGYQGLFLGVRFRGNAYTSQSLQGCVTYCDAVSANLYTSNPGASNPEFKAIDKPMIISEYCISTPAGNGKQSGGIETPISVSAENALMSAYYGEIKSWGNVVGTQWWEYMDESASGRFSDGENFGFGLVSITDRPYDMLTTPLSAELVKMETQW
jgi:hypothetical protein